MTPGKAKDSRPPSASLVISASEAFGTTSSRTSAPDSLGEHDGENDEYDNGGDEHGDEHDEVALPPSPFDFSRASDWPL
ncbi:hypothetical protein PG997_010734 [Apiospora hydei]|uniref:Uncharacterized protein n=1 Tax=Apiospora hydei TaxID=1337664 RepID=A0ABR1VH16_9PEZI